MYGYSPDHMPGRNPHFSRMSDKGCVTHQTAFWFVCCCFVHILLASNYNMQKEVGLSLCVGVSFSLSFIHETLKTALCLTLCKQIDVLYS